MSNRQYRVLVVIAAMVLTAIMVFIKQQQAIEKNKTTINQRDEK